MKNKNRSRNRTGSGAGDADAKTGLVAVYGYVDDLLGALTGLDAGRFRAERVFSPVPIPETEMILGRKQSNVRFYALMGGIVGGLAVLGLAVYAHLAFRLITGGKPILPFVPWVVVCFEGVILAAVLATVVSWVLNGRMPRFRHEPGYDPRFLLDRFGLLVVCKEEEMDRLRAYLEGSGAEEVQRVDW